MKPSEKINKMLLEAIQRDKVDPNDQNNTNMILLCAMQIQMMLDFLDEEWEKNKDYILGLQTTIEGQQKMIESLLPCTHKNSSPMYLESETIASLARVCNDCHLIFYKGAI